MLILYIIKRNITPWGKLIKAFYKYLLYVLKLINDAELI